MIYHMRTVTLLGRMNDINFQATVECEPEGPAEEAVDPMFILDILTQRARAAGVQPPVGKPGQDIRQGDKTPFPFGPDVRIKARDLQGVKGDCEHCNGDLYLRGGRSEKQKGRKWVQIYCTDCGAKDWWTDKQIAERWV